jgi:hypothetical protein
MADLTFATVSVPSGAPAAPDPSQAGEAAATTADTPAEAPKAPAEQTQTEQTAEQTQTEQKQPLRSRLLSIAESESRSALRQAAARNDFNRRSEFLPTAVPACYQELVAGLRSAVRAFNSSLAEIPDRPLARVGWFETPNVALRDALTGDGMRVRVSRNNSYFDLMLRLVSRSGMPDIPLIEGHGWIGRELVRNEVLMRIEGWVENGKVRFSYSLDFKRLQIPMEEVPDRIVMAVASHDYKILSRSYDPKPTTVNTAVETDGDA